MTNIYIISLFSFRNFFSFICILSLLSNIVFSQPLNGTKFIGPTGDYLTITDAINALYANSPNIDGPVVFSIEDGTYNENINITTAITGSNSTNTVTFISKSLNASSVTIAPTSSNIVINIQSSGNLIFQDITFTAPSTGMVALAITAGNITFTGNIFNGSSNIFSPNDQNILLLASLSGGKLNDVTISNNIFNNGYNGIVLGSEDYGDNLNILNNTFSTINSAINLNKFDAPYIKDNLITNSSNTYAISLTDVKNIFFVMNTKISTTTNSGSGILVTNANSTNLARGKVINNFIQAGLKGITLNNTDYVDVMYNSINIENASQTNDLTSAAFEALVLHSNSRINNNIFSNSRSGYTYIGITGTNNVSNYNDLYTTGPLIAKWNSTDQITISDFKTASGSNSFSVEAKPFYTSLTDLHASSPQIANGGTPLVYVFPDIDGQPRDSATPSIGANEFSSTATPLAGTYTIGSSGTFSNISEAVDALYYHGVSNTVEFQILPGSYNEQIDLNGIIPGGSSSSIITFKSQTGDPGDAVINYTSSNETDNFILRIDEAEYVNFKFLGFVAGGTNYSKIVQFENVNGNFEFYKNAFTGYANSTISDKNQAIFHLDDSGTLDNTNISSNNFIGGSYGMYLHLNSSTPGIVISGNTISPVGLGVFLTNANAPIISSNIINTDLFYGITLFNSTNNFVIEKNKIIGHSGISVNQSNGTSSLRGVIKNNFVAAKDNGIALNGATYTDVYFNSVHIDDNSPSISSSAFTMLSGANSQNIIKNNIFYNSIEGYAYNWDSGDLSGSDYNNLFTNGDFIGYYLNDNYKTLVDFITVTNFDDNSVSENLTFVSSTDLHIVGVNPPSPGITISSIADDIDGTVRIGTPTIGAAEFSPSPLNGIYTIGTSGDFQNITSAINYLYLY
ncbi:MAG: right-handed parallel beta-helix repeat-containing protein, partial [Melioribacteraceae bacterium]